MDKIEIVKTIIHSNLFMTLATAANDVPWSCPLFFAADKDLNLYFTSFNDSLHVKHIEQNPNVAVSIFDSHAIPGTGTTQAVYISGMCRRVQGEELPYAISVVYDRRFPDPKERKGRDLSIDRFSLPDSAGRVEHIYKIDAKKFYILDKEVGKDTRVEVQMK